jgi:hypothetical protein
MNTGNGIYPCLWNQLEITLGIITGSLPSLSAVFLHIFNMIYSTVTTVGSYVAHSVQSIVRGSDHTSTWRSEKSSRYTNRNRRSKGQSPFESSNNVETDLRYSKQTDKFYDMTSTDRVSSTQKQQWHQRQQEQETRQIRSEFTITQYSELAPGQAPALPTIEEPTPAAPRKTKANRPWQKTASPTFLQSVTRADQSMARSSIDSTESNDSALPIQSPP